MSGKELKKEYKLEKKAIKEEYKKERLTIKEKYLQSLDEYYAEIGIDKTKQPPRRSVLEEIGNAISHGLGTIFSIVALILMLISSKDGFHIASAIIYFCGMFLMFTMSTLYHSFKYGSKVKRIFRRFDYSSIYLQIGATFAPLLLCFVNRQVGIPFFIIQWIIIVTGITFVAIFGPGKIKALHMSLYIILGWSGLMFFPYMLKHNVNLLFFILGGGITYTLGIIPFALDKKVSHFIWHIFVFLGAVIQWIGIYIYVFL